jgi:hypothetical protein
MILFSRHQDTPAHPTSGREVVTVVVELLPEGLMAAF